MHRFYLWMNLFQLLMNRPEENFKKICLEYSDGPSRNKGGDLDWFKFDGMAKPFSEAAFKLKKGEITKKFVLKGVLATAGAKVAIEAAGGSVTE